MKPAEPLPSSFRDPSGQVYRRNGTIYRSVSPAYRADYDLLFSSGLYAELTENELLVPHEEISQPGMPGSYKELHPLQIPFVSYPYEWCFSQLKDAALLTLDIQLRALARGVSLKDASSYNVQFFQGKPLFIDTLSFEKYREGEPWPAYRQFCEHFLAPLALASKTDLRLSGLLALHLDGIPLDLAVRLLPRRSLFSPGLAAHLHLHAGSQKRHAPKDLPETSSQRHYRLPRPRLTALLEQLKSTVASLSFPAQTTVWDDYYDRTNYTAAARGAKEKAVAKWIADAAPQRLWDAGGNDGRFGRLASSKGIFSVVTDFDPVAIESAYRNAKAENDLHLLPLVIDLASPSPAIGWANRERDSFLERGHFDMALCLAVSHHLAISNNLPFSLIAEFFARQSRLLVMEFVPKEDSNTRRLLSHHAAEFPDYTQERFEEAFGAFFTIKEKKSLPESSRLLYLLERK